MRVVATKYETYPIRGHIERNDGSGWTIRQDRQFLADFLDWLKEQGLSFGGALGNPETIGGNRGD